MKCRDCQFISEGEVLIEGGNPQVRCTLGLWDRHVLDVSGQPTKKTVPQWHSYGESQLNRGPVRRFGNACNKGKPR